MINPFEKEKRENPEVKELCGALSHHVGHFLLRNVVGIENREEKYSGVENMQRAKELIDKLLSISQNESLASALQGMKAKLGDVDIESKPDAEVLDSIQKSLEIARIEPRF